MTKRIKQNFYTISAYNMVRITKADREEMNDEDREYWKDKDYWYVKKKLPDNRLYAGWGSRYPTKLTPTDLPDDYILTSDYKKYGYIRTAGVVDLVYHPSVWHNHSFKDDFIYISYTKPLGEYKEGLGEGSTFRQCDEYIWGNDIVSFILAAEKNSPQVDVSGVKQRMTEQYNDYVDEMNRIGFGEQYKRIDRLEDLR